MMNGVKKAHGVAPKAHRANHAISGLIGRSVPLLVCAICAEALCAFHESTASEIGHARASNTPTRCSRHSRPAATLKLEGYGARGGLEMLAGFSVVSAGVGGGAGVGGEAGFGGEACVGGKSISSDTRSWRKRSTPAAGGVGSAGTGDAPRGASPRGGGGGGGGGHGGRGGGGGGGVDGGDGGADVGPRLGIGVPSRMKVSPCGPSDRSPDRAGNGAICGAGCGTSGGAEVAGCVVRGTLSGGAVCGTSGGAEVTGCVARGTHGGADDIMPTGR